MAPYFETVKSFADVPITDAGVDTKEFLDASKGLLGIFTLLNSSAFAPVTGDIEGNIKKVEERYNNNPGSSATLEQLVINEQGEKKKTATQGLMWLLRGQSFTCKALQSAQGNPSQELSEAFTKGYEGSLKKHHNFVVKGVFSVAMKACPYRKDFYEKLKTDPAGGPPVDEAKFNEGLDQWLTSLESIVNRLEAFYAKGDYGKGL
ncbi:glycolipid transfer protein [Coniophora puteana RWD-64-598 SS2]|uniref:Glycolipid transfer protein n=1 Tax=Coniophora puteana (strain RWD-64-598) TaxID=741705 RepID=A0A5M3MWG8_CONPW|nr:glycolipid transfer protein [Coniophora puteana RWD-64-598 SS2]EIW83410.1 glycolipid transfer protein [Coniophora puteana RWD-64-598 SS2]